MTTVESEKAAAELATSVVEARLAGCVQVQAVRSTYRWDGVVRCEPEWLLLMKTREDRYSALEQHIRERHAYTTPEIVMLPIVTGLPAYLQWLEAENLGVKEDSPYCKDRLRAASNSSPDFQ